MSKLSYGDALEVYFKSDNAPYSTYLEEKLQPSEGGSRRNKLDNAWLMRCVLGTLAIVYDSGKGIRPFQYNA